MYSFPSSSADRFEWSNILKKASNFADLRLFVDLGSNPLRTVNLCVVELISRFNVTNEWRKKQARELGIQSRVLKQLVQQNKLEQISRGLYCIPGKESDLKS